VLWRFADVRHWGARAMTKLGCHKLRFGGASAAPHSHRSDAT
jgi:hypothetical protein